MMMYINRKNRRGIPSVDWEAELDAVDIELALDEELGDLLVETVCEGVERGVRTGFGGRKSGQRAKGVTLSGRRDGGLEDAEGEGEADVAGQEESELAAVAARHRRRRAGPADGGGRRRHGRRSGRVGSEQRWRIYYTRSAGE
jgi:hypothetical protein